MAIQVNLAMTGAEIQFSPSLPRNIAWMACHFSPCSLGLSNVPEALPPDSLLVLDDQSPFCGQDPERIAEELDRCVRDFQCSSVLLDFQRPGVEEVKALAAMLPASLPCPVAVTACYAQETDAAVFLPPLPCHISLKEWITPWKGRTLWLELALEQEIILLTDKGAQVLPGDFEACRGFADKKLHCHYAAAVEEDRVVFNLWRTGDDLAGLLEEAAAMGIKQAVGLYQELGIPSWM